MPAPILRSMSPAGYFSTGVAVGLLVGVFVGFIAHGILKQDSATAASDADLYPQRLDASDALAPAPSTIWGDDAETPPPPVRDDAPTPASPEDSPRPDATADDPFVHGQKVIPAWPPTNEDATAPSDEEEDDTPTRPNPGGARLSDDPSVSFDAPED